MRRLLLRVVLWTVIVALLAGIGGLLAVKDLMDRVGRIPDVFAGMEPRPAGDEATLYLLVLAVDHLGSDQVAWLPDGGRVDAALLVRVEADRRSVLVTSLPLGARVPVPGHGDHPLQAVLDLGGPALTVAAVQRVSGVTVDHFAVVDVGLFAELGDELGGIQLTDGFLTGDDAVAHAFVKRDAPELVRIDRQQQVMRSALGETLHTEMRRNPLDLWDLLESVATYSAVEEGWETSDMLRLAVSLRNLRSRDIQYAVGPVRCAQAGLELCPFSLSADPGQWPWALPSAAGAAAAVS